MSVHPNHKKIAWPLSSTNKNVPMKTISLWFGVGQPFKRATVHDADTHFAPLEVLLDPCRTWCPSSTCQAVCQLKEADSPALPQLVQCAVCALEFCSACKANWHPGQACQENNLPITSFLPGENRYCLFMCLSLRSNVPLHFRFLFSQFLSHLCYLSDQILERCCLTSVFWPPPTFFFFF